MSSLVTKTDKCLGINQKTTEVNHVTQEYPKKRQASNEPICSNPRDRLTHEIECLNREIEEQKIIIWSLKEEGVKKAWVHETDILDIHNKDQIICRISEQNGEMQSCIGGHAEGRDFSRSDS